MSEGLRDERADEEVWHVHWTHPTENGRSFGDAWDRETAEHIAENMRRSGARDVEVWRHA